MKKTSIFQISLILAGLFSAGLSRGANDDYLVIDISSGYGSENYPVTYYGTLPGNVTDSVYKSDKIVLKKISAGTFTMGSSEAEPGRPIENPDEDQHQVTLTEDFYIGVFEITAYQWNALTALGDSNLKPAVDNTVTIENIKNLQESFLGVLNSKTTLNGVLFDLPTEAQWEYACRAGTQSAYSFGNNEVDLQNYAWYFDYDSSLHEVGLKNPNPWGLYDMHGNAAEFCRDAYNAALGTVAVTDPFYAAGTAEKVERGGAYNLYAADLRSAARNAISDAGTYRTGFRISLTMPAPPEQYQLTVISGSGDGSYTNNHVQQIIADTPEQWFEFDQWSGNVANVANVYDPTTTVTIVNADITLGATYKAQLFEITVSNGTASAYSATNGQIVALYADAPATETNVFWRWQGDIAGVADIYAMTTTLAVAGADANLRATYRDAPYLLTVTGGSGGGGYHFEGEVVAIQAPAPDAHQLFLWQGAASFDNIESWNTTLIMPGADTTVTATYPAKKYNLTVVNGNGSGSYTNGAVVPISTVYTPSTLHEFDGWAGDSAQLANPTLQSTSFTVNNSDAIVFPVYKPQAAVKGEYMVVNLITSGSRFDVSYQDTPPAGGWGNDYKDNKMVFRRILPGTYQMGTADSGAVENEDIHTVTLTKAFYMGIYEVTQGQWYNIMDNYPSGYSGSERSYHPVESISYDTVRGAVKGRDWPSDADVDAASFVGVMRIKAGSDGFDLPTEAQWEYACRAGTTGSWYSNDILNIAVYNANSSSNTWVVGSKVPNAWGLYDMHGNVWEWCLDWYDGPLGTAPQTDPVGAPAPNANYYRLKRGGAYDTPPLFIRSGVRGGKTTTLSAAHTGLRMIKTAGEPNVLTLVDSKINTGGVYHYRAKIAISAVDKPGMIFDRWSVTPSDAFAGASFDATARDTIVTMPNYNITVTAVYR